MQGREAVVVADILVGSESNVSSVPRMKAVANSACLNPRVNGGDVAAGDGCGRASDESGVDFLAMVQLSRG